MWSQKLKERSQKWRIERESKTIQKSNAISMRTHLCTGLKFAGSLSHYLLHGPLHTRGLCPVVKSFLSGKKNNSNEEFSYGSIEQSVNFKEPILLNPHFLISQRECYSAFAIHSYSSLSWRKTDICGGALLEHQGLCSGIPAANLSFPICYSYYLSPGRIWKIVKGGQPQEDACCYLKGARSNGAPPVPRAIFVYLFLGNTFENIC